MIGLKNRGNLPSVVEDEFQHLIARIKAVFLQEHNEDGTHFVRPSGFDFVPIGTIVPWPTNAAPTGWALCQGQPLSRVDYASLFGVIGTTFGSGDGSTTFNVPNLQGRFPLGKASAGTGSTLAGTGGSLDHTHGFSSTVTDAGGDHNHGGATGSGGNHTHSVSGTTDRAAYFAFLGSTIPGLTDTSDVLHSHDFSATTDAPGDHTHSISSSGTHTHGLSGGTTDANNPPYLVINYIILTGRA